MPRFPVPLTHEERMLFSLGLLQCSVVYHQVAGGQLVSQEFRNLAVQSLPATTIVGCSIVYQPVEKLLLRAMLSP